MNSTMPVSIAVSIMVRRKAAATHGAIAEHGQRQAIQHGERGNLGRGGDAQQDAGEQHHRHAERQHGAQAGAQQNPPAHPRMARARSCARAPRSAAIRQSAITAAGTRPPMNSAAIERLVMEPSTSMAIDGGTVSPIAAEAASTAAPSASG